MRFRFAKTRLVAGTLASAVLILGGCSTLSDMVDTVKNKPYEYRQTSEAKPLEVPPDLTSTSIDDARVVPDIGVPTSGSASLSDYQQERAGGGSYAVTRVLPGNARASLVRDGDRQWLVVHADADNTWELVRDFWLSNGFSLKREQPDIGVMETEWAENRAEIPSGPIRSVLSKALDFVYDAGTRDKFRVRLERGKQPGTTEVYLTHRRAEEVLDGSGDTSRWELRPADPEVEADWTKRLMNFMGAEQARDRSRLAQKAQGRQLQARVSDVGGQPVMTLKTGFSASWRAVGVALDRVDFTVEDRDRSRGLYFVRYADPLEGETKKGWLSSLAFWRSSDAPKAAQYRVHVAAVADGSQVKVLAEDGKPAAAALAKRILNLLAQQLR